MPEPFRKRPGMTVELKSTPPCAAPIMEIEEFNFVAGRAGDSVSPNGQIQARTAEPETGDA